MIDFKDMEDVKETINVQGARVHNLKNIDVEIPRGSLTVITGLSEAGIFIGFDTIFAEDKDVISKRFLLMREIFWVEWNVRMWIR